jgi:hypothetical protein
MPLIERTDDVLAIIANRDRIASKGDDHANTQHQSH